MKHLVLIFALVVPATAYAAGLTSIEETQQTCAAAAAKFASGDPDGAYAVLSPYWPLPKEEVQNLGYQTKTQLGMVSDRFGAPVSAEFAKTSLVGQSLVKQLFLIKYEKHAIRFSCVFYKPRNEWLVNVVSWDDKPQESFPQ